MTSTGSTLAGVEADEARVPSGALTTAELAECTCPDFCERDHDTDLGRQRDRQRRPLERRATALLRGRRRAASRPLHDRAHDRAPRRRAPLEAPGRGGLRRRAGRPYRRAGGADGARGAEGDLPLRLAGRRRCKPRGPDVPRPVALPGEQRSRARQAAQQRAPARRPDRLRRGQERHLLAGADRRRRRGRLRRRPQRVRADEGVHRGGRGRRPLRGPARLGEEVRSPRREGARPDEPVHPHPRRCSARRGRLRGVDDPRRPHRRAECDPAHERHRRSRSRVHDRRANARGLLPGATRARGADRPLARVRAVRRRALVRNGHARHGRGAPLRRGDPRRAPRQVPRLQLLPELQLAQAPERRRDRALPARARRARLPLSVHHPRRLPRPERVDVRAREGLCGPGHAGVRRAPGARARARGRRLHRHAPPARRRRGILRRGDGSSLRRTELDTGPRGLHRRGAVRGRLAGVTTAPEVVAPADAEIISRDALAFVELLQRELGPRRLELLERRRERQRELDGGARPDFLAETRNVREGDWRVAPPPADLQDRRVEITGPVDRKMMINALNSGARVFMADFEDANSPTWRNCIEGQANLVDAVERTIRLDTGAKTYELRDDTATLVVRPRGWHLVEKHATLDGEPVSASLFDFGLYVFHCAQKLVERGSGPYFYLPKLESHREAALWHDAFSIAEDELQLERGTIRATVLIETILAAFEMDEILYALGPHATGLNAGRWDYIFSVIKKLGDRPEFVLPDRAAVTMAVPFMRAYADLLVRTCHRRGAHAIGGMAAFIPSRRDEAVNAIALAKVREDKEREAGQGFDGTWVAHPDLVPVATEIFDRVLGERQNQVERQRDDVIASAAALLDVAATPGEITEEGLRNNVSVGIQYLAAWLRGSGAVAIFNLMEDAATSEISRSQVWQWLRHGRVTRADVERAIDEEVERLGDGYDEARALFEQVALTDGDSGDEFVEFLTLPAYEHLVKG